MAITNLTIKSQLLSNACITVRKLPFYVLTVQGSLEQGKISLKVFIIKSLL